MGVLWLFSPAAVVKMQSSLQGVKTRGRRGGSEAVGETG